MAPSTLLEDAYLDCQAIHRLGRAKRELRRVSISAVVVVKETLRAQGRERNSASICVKDKRTESVFDAFNQAMRVWRAY